MEQNFDFKNEFAGKIALVTGGTKVLAPQLQIACTGRSTNYQTGTDYTIECRTGQRSDHRLLTIN